MNNEKITLRQLETHLFKAADILRGKKVWDASTFSQSRRRRFDPLGFMEQLFDETVKRAMEAGLVRLHASADGTLVRANASYKSFAPIEVGQSPEDYKASRRSEDPQELEVFRGPASETSGCVAILDRVRERQGYRPSTLGADKGYFAQEFLRALFERGIDPPIASRIRGKKEEHQRVRALEGGTGYTLSQRCRKKIEELFGEGKEFHGLRRFRRRFLYRVREELYLIATVLNYKRLATVRASG